MPLQAQGEFVLVREELESALELSGQPVKRGTMAHRHIVYMMLSDAAAQCRDVAALSQYTSSLEELAVRDGHQPYLAVAHRSWGVAHRLNGAYDEAEARLNQALALFQERQAHWQIGRTLLECAELALARSEKSTAREFFSRALAEFESLKARPDVERTRAALQAQA